MLEFRPRFWLFSKRQAYNLYRNVARFYLAEEGFCNNEHYVTYLFNLAQACEMVGDFFGAELYLNQVRQNYPEWNTEIVSIEFQHLAIRRKRKFVEVKCDNQRLKNILENLVSVFFKINKNVNVFTVENEGEFKNLALEKLGFHQKSEIPTYIDWRACGFYKRPEVHCLVFKKEYIPDDDDALIGLCAHELAHFELYDTETVQNTLHGFETSNIFLFREWTTDMQVMQRGFAYELFRSREVFSESESRVLTAQEIKHFVQKIANYSEML